MRILTLTCTGLLATALCGCIVAPAPYAEQEPEPASYEASDQITEPPPPLPVYEQPPCPVDGYIWTPGIWEWGPAGYYWVPGTWVEPPAVGLLWTPGYWGFAGGVYLFHRGYWGPRVGFYGGVNYGHGYFGAGYAGGRWADNRFHYNTAVTNVNVTNIHNTYNQTIVNNVNVTNVTNITRVSYSGGAGGARTTPNADEVAAAREAHVPPTGTQVQHEATARTDPQLSATHNEGRPPIAATPRAGALSGAGVVAARPVGPVYRPQAPPTARATQANPFVHARDIAAPAAYSPGNSGAGQDYARRQGELQARQEQERQTLARQQEQEHTNLASQPVHNHQAYQAMERQHQQQTSQMVQRHQQEREQFSPKPR